MLGVRKKMLCKRKLFTAKVDQIYTRLPVGKLIIETASLNIRLKVIATPSKANLEQTPTPKPSTPTPT